MMHARSSSTGSAQLSRPRETACPRLNTVAILAVLLCLASTVPAQISLATAVDLALRSNPRVKGAQDDIDRARAQLSEVHDAYVPTITAGAAIGQAYGYSPYPPTLFTVNSGFLVYNRGQSSYARSAEDGVKAAQLALMDVREQVAEDTALAYLALDHDRQREQLHQQQIGFAGTLVTIVQDRLDAGQDTQIDLTQAKLTAAQLRLALLRDQDETAVDRDRLARLIDLPPAGLQTSGDFPSAPVPVDASSGTTANGYATPAVASAFASADARLQQAKGDARYRYWPRINAFAQYNRYATFSDSFTQLQKLYQFGGSSNTTLSADEAAIGVQISIPIFDKSSGAKARESSAVAARALHDAQNAQIEALDGQSRLRHTISEIGAQLEVATLQQQLAQQQLDVVRLQQQSTNPNGPPITPKDEQNARIAERDKYLAVIDAGFQVHQAQIQLLRQTGGLESWLTSTTHPAVQNTLPPAPTPKP